MNASRLLEPYRPQMCRASQWELASRLLDWCLEHLPREDPAALARMAYVASTFDLYCCAPGATLEENLLGAQFLIIFFVADDGSEEELASFLAEADGPPSHPSGLRACYDAWLEGLRRRGLDTRRLRVSVRKMCEWFLLERRLDQRTLTEERYREIRQNTIAVNVYVDCWATLRGLSPSEPADEALRRSHLLELASELVYITNDLGSLERDEEAARKNPAGGDLNLVLLRARTLGNRQEALQQVVELYHETLRDFRHRRADLVGSEHWREPAVRDYVELVRCMTNGNLGATRYLMALRYPGAQATLAGLPDVEPLASA